MSRHVAGDTDGRNSVGRRSFDCLQSPPRPSLAHRRRTRLAAAHGELYGFPSRAGVFAAFSMPGENRFRIFGAVPPRPEGPSAKYSEPTHEEFQAMLDERLPLPAKVVKEYPIGSELHQVTDLVWSFTGGFIEQSIDEGQPGGADTQGTTAGPAPTYGHQPADEHSSEAASADAA